MKKTILIILYVFGFGSVFCQTNQLEVITTSGDYFKPSPTSPSLSWTAGEPVTETFSSSGNVLTQGFQQSNYNITAIDEVKVKDISINVFPNPTSDFITIAITSLNGTNADYVVALYDLQGQLLYTANYSNTEFELDLSSYPTGTYILTVLTKENQTVQNFKIQKTK